ncbi:cardiotrophin-1 isoform X2 [Elgaria multicarinata webbii]|uniref:cardiotrophin-1 isoform X2 n=1 Tax=Elgaria multicarinata webbii TaxID=159646 RepID=UPI002FCD31FE
MQQVSIRRGGEQRNATRRGRMEVLSVDLPKRLSSSSSWSQQEIALKIQQTHKLTIHMQDGSQQLLTDYAFHQGKPFGDPSFNPAIQSFEGLPRPPISTQAWLDLSDAERLQQNATVFSNFPEFLTLVRRQQANLNPQAVELLRQLDSASAQCFGLVSNLQSIMASLGIAPGPAMPTKLPATGSAFLMKLTGYSICRLYQGWTNCCQKAMALLVTKYPV